MGRWRTRMGEGIAVLVVGSLLAGQLLGQPILLGFVTTGSMAPTLEAGDGFVAVPASLAGQPEVGDVVTFRAETLHGGGLTTHRIVRETDRGYVTRGDANPFSDQAGDEPPVRESQIVAHALRVGGQVVVIPELGTAVTTVRDAVAGTQLWLATTVGLESLAGTRGLAYLVLAVSAVGYLLDLVWASGPSRKADRPTSREQGHSVRLVILAMAAVVVLSATAAMVVPAGTQELNIVSAEFDSGSPTTIRQGETATLPYRVANGGFVPVHVYLRPASDGITVDTGHLFVGGREMRQVRLRISAPRETGAYRRYLVEYRYLAVLPEPLIRTLLGVHPWLPLLAVDALMGGSVYALGRLLVDDGRVRRRARRVSSSRLARLFRSP